MIKIGDNYYRNLEEQVQKNKEDIANHYNIDRVLAEVGIKVIGQLPTPEDLKNKVGNEYGDTYAIGTQPPYDFYIWTRADLDSGRPEDYWFNIGQLAIVGPQGPQGPQGERGANGESSMWYYGTAPSNPREGDMLLQSSGNVLRYQKVGPLQYSWVQVVNIKGANGLNGLQGPKGATGPQGPQGPKGDTGDVGGFINIYGILTNVNQLPTPDTLNNRTIAYLIGTGYPYDLYIQVGDADGPVTWVNSGPLNVSTLVFVDGEAQNTWNADVKADVTYVDNAIASIPKPDLTGYATKQYVDDAIANIDIPEGGGGSSSDVVHPIFFVDLYRQDTWNYHEITPEMQAFMDAYQDNNGHVALYINVNSDTETLWAPATVFLSPYNGQYLIYSTPDFYRGNGLKEYFMCTIYPGDNNWYGSWHTAESGGGGGSDWSYTTDVCDSNLYNAKEIYICVKDDTGIFCFSHRILGLEEYDTLGNHTYENCTFTIPDGSDSRNRYWFYDGSCIQISFENGYDTSSGFIIAYK